MTLVYPIHAHTIWAIENIQKYKYNIQKVNFFSFKNVIRAVWDKPPSVVPSNGCIQLMLNYCMTFLLLLLPLLLGAPLSFPSSANQTSPTT